MTADRVDGLVATAAEWHPDRVALRASDGSTVTWGELEREVAATAGWLRDGGIGTGDRVALALPNGIDFARGCWGALRAGATCVPVNPGYTAREIAHMLADSGARAVITHPALLPTVRAAAEAAPQPLTVHAGLRRGAPAHADPPPDGLALLCYTAGTTGSPKGARLTHRNLLANLGAFERLPALVLDADDVMLGVLPFFHIFGLNVILNHAARAGACVVALERFAPSATVAAMAVHGVTVAYGAPPVFAALAAMPDPPELPALRAAVSGADALPVPTFEAFLRRYGIETMEGYGLTEAAPVVASNACSPAVRPGTVGHPLPGVDVRILDRDGGVAAPDDVGEIAVRGDNVFDGYQNHPDATAEALAGGLLHTGDLGTFDAEGYLRIVGRAKDLVIVSGYNVYPAEVEAVLLSHPDVSDAAVVGAPDARTGERVRAFVVPRPGAHLEADTLLAHCRAGLARYKLPRDVEVVDALPRSLLGKLRRAALREAPTAG